MSDITYVNLETLARSIKNMDDPFFGYGPRSSLHFDMTENNDGVMLHYINRTAEGTDQAMIQMCSNGWMKVGRYSVVPELESNNWLQQIRNEHRVYIPDSVQEALDIIKDIVQAVVANLHIPCSKTGTATEDEVNEYLANVDPGFDEIRLRTNMNGICCHIPDIRYAREIVDGHITTTAVLETSYDEHSRLVNNQGMVRVRSTVDVALPFRSISDLDAVLRQVAKLASGRMSVQAFDEERSKVKKDGK